MKSPCDKKAILHWPTSFAPDCNLVQILTQWGKTVEEGHDINWATAEALTFGSLALKKIHACVSG